MRVVDLDLLYCFRFDLDKLEFVAYESPVEPPVKLQY